MFVYIDTYIHTYIHTYITYVRIYLRTYVHTYIHTYILIYLHIYRSAVSGDKDVDIEAVACVHNLQYSSVQYSSSFHPR